MSEDLTSILVYADDTVLIGKTEGDLQNIVDKGVEKSRKFGLN